MRVVFKVSLSNPKVFPFPPACKLRHALHLLSIFNLKVCCNYINKCLNLCSYSLKFTSCRQSFNEIISCFPKWWDVSVVKTTSYIDSFPYMVVWFVHNPEIGIKITADRRTDDGWSLRCQHVSFLRMNLAVVWCLFFMMMIHMSVCLFFSFYFWLYIVTFYFILTASVPEWNNFFFLSYSPSRCQL